MFVETEIFSGGPKGNTLFQYLMMMYCSVLTFAKVEICPRSNLEIMACVTIILISAMVNAQIFGIFASLSEELNSKSFSFEEDMNNANTTMDQIKMPADIQSEIRTYIQQTFYLKEN
jgi:hypothetical protein